MKILESAARIAVVSIVVFVWMLMSGLPKALANDDDDNHKTP